MACWRPTPLAKRERAAEQSPEGEDGVGNSGYRVVVNSCHIDHIAVTAASLEAGAEYVVQALGIRPQAGGEHQRMGTHNLVMRLGESTYLEVIAPNPEAPRPQRPRWFALDDPQAVAQPRLATWIARTTNIREAVAALPERLGQIEPMSRGALNWLITVPSDGSLPLGGVAPALIEWQVPAHPASRMPDVGCSLVRLELFHPEPQRVVALLGALGLQESVEVLGIAASERPFLVAHIRTPHGVRTIGAPPTIEGTASDRLRPPSAAPRVGR